MIDCPPLIRHRRHHLASWITLVLLLMLAGSASAAADNEPLDRILTVARAFLTENLASGNDTETKIHLGRLDERLRLTRCANPPKAQLAPGGHLEGNTTVNVRCSQPVGWSIFVPVRIERYRPVVILDRPISRQQVIQPRDVKLERQEISSLTSGYFTDTASVIGMQSKRRLLPGQVLTSAHLAPRKLVERGQQVTLFAARPGLTVRMKGVALEDGVEGQRIRIRNDSSKRIVEGYVEPSGAVRAAL